jgi:translation initiation factor 2A
MASSLQFGYRTQKALNVFEAAPVYEQLDGFARYDGNSRCCAYSPCGRYFSWASPEAVSVHDASSGRVVTALPIPNVIELGHSPQGTFLITLERPTKDDAGDAAKNLKVWKTIEDGVQGGDKQPIGRFVQKSHTDFNLQYTADEKYCARLVSNEIQFFESTDLATVWDRLRVEGVANFALSPGGVHSVAVYVPERKVSSKLHLFLASLACADHCLGTTGSGQSLQSPSILDTGIAEDVLQRRQGQAGVEQRGQ